MSEFLSLEKFRNHPNDLARHYTKFDVQNRYLLTGHSHQAWPDCSIEGLLECWDDSSKYVDDKWALAAKKAKAVENGYARLLEDDSGHIALASSTHDLLVKFLSGLNLRKRNQIVTTDSEFHSIRRQLNRLNEEKFVEVIQIAGHPVENVVTKLIERINDRTAAVVISAVYFNSGQIVNHLHELVSAAEFYGAKVLIDAYHALNVIPFSVREQKLENAFILGGGYKYCQLGEGNAFLRFPSHCDMRPVITGWFSEWETLSKSGSTSPTQYGGGSGLFAGSTYDPLSHYRAASVFEFFLRRELTVSLLRQISQHQIGLMCKLFDDMDPNPDLIRRNRSIPLREIAGFLCFQSPQAENIYRSLKASGVQIDFRGDVLRLGPAPYLSDQQIIESMQILEKVLNEYN